MKWSLSAKRKHNLSLQNDTNDVSKLRIVSCKPQSEILCCGSARLDNSSVRLFLLSTQAHKNDCLVGSYKNWPCILILLTFLNIHKLHNYEILQILVASYLYILNKKNVFAVKFMWTKFNT